MTCGEVRKLLEENIQARNELEVNGHLHQCPECYAVCGELLSLESLSELLRDQVRAPSDFLSKVEVSIRRSFIGWKPVFAVGVVVLVSIMALWSLSITDGIFEPHQFISSSQEIKQENMLSGKQIGAEWPTLESKSDGYVDIILEDHSRPKLIVRLPLRIEIQTGQLNQDSFLEHVSH